ncbi:MAG TPA: hypothetical protein VKU35_04370 [Candidatus Limnocylindria bacterium]|nr:hypothetical protein [Candidatus Limnocylindria bacterium]
MAEPMAPDDLEFTLIDEESFAAIPSPARPGSRCQTCDYWERLDGYRDAPAADATGADTRAALKRQRLLAGRQLAGAYGMLAWRGGGDGRVAVGWAQFGPISAYPRAQSIRERYPALPDSPPPWVVTCLQVMADAPDRDTAAIGLLEAVCAELDRRGITAVEAFPEGRGDDWVTAPGPIRVYAAAGFEQAAGDERYPVMRRELGGSGESLEWGDLLARAQPPADQGEGWPLPLPNGPSEEDLFRLPPPKPRRPNPFGED